MDAPHENLATIYFITPTDNNRITQLADLTRLRNTLLLVPNLVWILVEDSETKTNKIENFLRNSRIPNVHLNKLTPADLKIDSVKRTKRKGALQRNCAIKWLTENIDVGQDGVVYFGDDDNTYDIRLFEQVILFK